MARAANPVCITPLLSLQCHWPVKRDGKNTVASLKVIFMADRHTVRRRRQQLADAKRLQLRLPKRLWDELDKKADEEGISINSIICDELKKNMAQAPPFRVENTHRPMGSCSERSREWRHFNQRIHHAQIASNLYKKIGPQRTPTSATGDPRRTQ